MATEQTWWNTDFVLFLDRDGEKVFMRCVSVERIVWEWPNTARIVLCGRLPESAYFLSMEDGIRLELLKICYPDPYYYEGHEIVFSFYDGKVKRRWTPHFTVTGPEHQGPVEIYMSLECSYRKHFEKERG